MKKQIQVKQTKDKINIKDFLTVQEELSSRRVKQLLKNKQITLNGKTAYFDNDVKAGDVVEVDLSETGKDSTVPEEIFIDVIYEDEYFLAVNKPAGMLVHPTQNFPTGTLSNGVKHYFLSRGVDIPVRLANRIDRDTSGLVVIAKSGEAHSALAAQFELDSCEKYYLAIAEGYFRNCKGSIDKPIGLDEENTLRRAVREDGQPSRTEYDVLKQYRDAALVRLKLLTGRTHQIRVHLKSLGHPLLGDALYEGSMAIMDRQALHAHEMVFVHPFDKTVVTLKAPLPKDMEELIEKLEKNS